MFHSALLALSKCLRRRNKRLCFPTTTCIKSSNLSRENKKKKSKLHHDLRIIHVFKGKHLEIKFIILNRSNKQTRGNKKNYSKLCSRHDEIRPHLVLHNDNRIWFPITKESVNSHRCIQRCKLLKIYKLKHINKSSEILLYHQATVKE